MYDFPSDPVSSAGHSPGPGYDEHRHSTLSLILLIAAVAVIGIIAIGFTFWALGFLFHVFGLVLKIAILAGVAALVWRRVARGRCRRF